MLGDVDFRQLATLIWFYYNFNEEPKMLSNLKQILERIS